MAEDLASLLISVKDVGVNRATRDLNRLERQGRQTERATDGLAAGFRRLIGPIAATVTAGAGLSKLLSTAREFQVLESSLITATGSAEKAEKAFTALQDFATTTPFQLQEVVQAFIKLQNLGLTPSEEALMAYGDTSAAMGKDLNQMIEAVADAATGEFERLKEFGIKASKQGEQVTFTFKGVRETVAFESGAIEDYLIGLSQQNFAGGMTRQMETIDGAMSNLGDEFDKFVNNINKSGVADLMERGIRGVIDVLEELNAFMESGAFAKTLEIWGEKFGGFSDDATRSLEIVSNYMAEEYSREMIAAGALTDNTTDFMVEAFENMPENVRAAVKLLAVELASLVDVGSAYGKAFGEVLGYEFAGIIDKAGIFAEHLRKELNPFEDFDQAQYESDLAEANTRVADLSAEAFDRAADEAERAREARKLSIMGIIEERDAAVGSYETQKAEIGQLLEEHRKLVEQRRNQSGDRLAGMGGTGGEGSDGPNATQVKLMEDVEKAREAYATEEELLQEKYEKEMELYRAARENEVITDQEYNQYKLEAAEAYLEEYNSIYDSKAKERVELEQSANDAIGSARRGALQAGIQLLQHFAQENKTAAYAVLAIQKGLAIAEAVSNTAVASTRAIAELGPVFGPPAAAKIKLWGAAQVGLIAATGILEAQGIGGGGSAPSTGGGGGGGGYGGAIGGPTNAVETPGPERESRSSVQFIFNGAMNTIDEATLANDLAREIGEKMENTDFVMFSANSRQARELQR